MTMAEVEHAASLSRRFDGLSDGARAVACVDIGGTKVAVSIANAAGFVSKVAEATVKEGSPSALADQVIRLVELGSAQAGISASSLTAVGVASCGPFVMRDGQIELVAPNICGGLAGQDSGLPNRWMSAPLEAPLRNAFHSVRVENDAVAALEAERRWGALQGLDDCAYVTWSTGIGVGLCVDGRILRGKNGNAGHAGHMFVSSDLEALCRCGNLGDVEGIIAGSAIARRYAAAGYADAAALFAAAKSADPRAQEIMRGLIEVMGRTLYNLIVTLDLQRIALGGSVFWHHRDFLLPPLRAFLAGRFASITDNVDIIPAGLGLEVGDYAALALVA
jgi:glucokinase